MADFGTYQGHTIMSQAMDSTLNRQLAKDELNMKKKSQELADTLNQMAIDDTLASKARTKLMGDIIRNTYGSREGENSLFIDDGYGNMIANPNTATLLGNYAQDFDMKSILDADSSNILRPEDYTKLQSNLVNVGKDDLLQIKERFKNMSDLQQDEYLSMPGVSEQINILRTRVGADNGLSNKEFFNTSSGGTELPEITSGTMLEKGWGGVQEEEESDWGGAVKFAGFSDPTRDAKKSGQILWNAVKNNKNMKSDNWFESDTVTIRQTGENSWELEENDWDLGTGWGNDVYTVKVKNGKPLIDMGGGDWQDLNKADF